MSTNISLFIMQSLALTPHHNVAAAILPRIGQDIAQYFTVCSDHPIRHAIPDTSQAAVSDCHCSEMSRMGSHLKLDVVMFS